MRRTCVFVFGQRDDHRHLAVGGQPVAFVRLHVLALEEHRLRRHERAQRRRDFALAREIDRYRFDDGAHAVILAYA